MTTTTERIMFYDEQTREWVVDTIEIQSEEETTEPSEDGSGNGYALLQRYGDVPLSV